MEKNNVLIDNLLKSKSSWWNLFWGRVKAKRNKDSLYLKFLDGIRQRLLVQFDQQDVVKKNSKEDGKDAAYSVYIDKVQGYLVAQKKRLLTKQEEEIIIAHLTSVAETFCLAHSAARNDADLYKGLNIRQVLAIETAKTVNKMHPDFPELTEAQLVQKTKEVLVVQNFLNTENKNEA